MYHNQNLKSNDDIEEDIPFWEVMNQGIDQKNIYERLQVNPVWFVEEKDVQAHHLTLSQPQAMSLKVGDQFTIPLCVFHHSELHRITEKNFGKHIRR